MVIRNFQPFKTPPPAPVGIPIIGEGPQSAPPQVRDMLGRILAPGDLIHLQTVQIQPYKVLKIAPMPVAPGQPPGLMEVLLQSTVRFAAPRDQGNVEFLRIMTAVEAQPVEKVEVTPAEPPAEEERPSLKDA